MSKEGPDKKEQFRLLTEADFKTPPYGRVVEVNGTWWADEKQWVRDVVVYDDLTAHCGEGKRYLQEREFRFDGGLSRLPAIYELQEKFCCAYVGNRYKRIPSCSWRLLQLGYHRFWIEYTSRDDWRSNCGDSWFEVIEVSKDYGKGEFHLPIWAVDFVIGKEMYAVDLNVAPGTTGLHLERFVSNKEIAKSIEQAFELSSPQC